MIRPSGQFVTKIPGITIREASASLGVDEKVVRTLLRTKGLPTGRCPRNGNAKLISPAVLDQIRRALAPETGRKGA